MRIGMSTDSISCFKNIIRGKSPYLIYSDEAGKIVATKATKEEVTEEKKMPKNKINSVFMIVAKSVVGEARRGRRHPMTYGLLNDLEKAKNSDLWWLADYFFFADWAEDHYGQVSTDSSMSKAGILDCPSTSTSVDAVDPVDTVDAPAPRTSKRKKI